jgi:hypothetical protein
MVCSDPAFVVAEYHVHDPVQAVLDGPMASDDWPEKMRQHDQRRDVIARLAFDLAAEFTRAFDDGDSVQARPVVPLAQPFDIVDDRSGAGLDPAIVSINRLGSVRISVCEARSVSPTIG